MVVRTKASVRAWRATSSKYFANSKKSEKLDPAVKTVVEDQNCCSVCLDEDVIDRTTLDSCKHTFCYPCISRWLKIKPNCPYCKQVCAKITCVSKGIADKAIEMPVVQNDDESDDDESDDEFVEYGTDSDETFDQWGRPLSTYFAVEECGERAFISLCHFVGFYEAKRYFCELANRNNGTTLDSRYREDSTLPDDEDYASISQLGLQDVGRLNVKYAPQFHDPLGYSHGYSETDNFVVSDRVVQHESGSSSSEEEWDESDNEEEEEEANSAFHSNKRRRVD